MATTDSTPHNVCVRTWYRSFSHNDEAQTVTSLSGALQLRKVAFFLALGLVGCESTQPPELRVMRWKGVAVPIEAAMMPTEAAMMADTAVGDTTFVLVEYEHTYTTDRILATYTIWEPNPDPCELRWLPEDDKSCWYMTEAEGVQTPFEMPTSRVIGMVLPKLGKCTLAGWISYPSEDSEQSNIVWDALMRCGDDAVAIYSISLLYEPEYR